MKTQTAVGFDVYIEHQDGIPFFLPSQKPIYAVIYTVLMGFLLYNIFAPFKMLYKIKLFELHYKYSIKDNFSFVYKNLTSLLDNRENR